MAPLLTLYLDGAFRARLDGSALDGLSRRAQAMLAFLAMQKAMRAERSTLAALLWPDRSGEQARASLRQELSVARRALGAGLLDADRQAVWLDPARVRTDGTGGDGFMQGFDLASEPFEDWLRLQRSTDAAGSGPGPPQPVPRLRDAPAVAVLPFPESAAATGDTFADGIVDEITGALGRVGDFDVIARQSAFALKDLALGAQAAAARLGANYLVEGTVRRAGDRVRVAVQLVRGRDGHAVWSARFDDREGDLFDLQDRIAMQVAGQLSPNLRSAEIARAAALPPEHRSAYSLTLGALPHFWVHRKQDNARAIALLDQAVRLSPDYAPALAYKGWALAQQPSYMWSDDPAADRAAAVAAAEATAQLTQTHVGSLVAIGATYSLATDRTDIARHHVERALVIDPNNAWGWMRRAWIDLLDERWEDALAAFARAETLSPLDPFWFNFMIGRAMVHIHLGELDIGLDLLMRAVNAAPGLKWAHRLIASVNQRLGQTEAARASMRELLAAYPDLTLEKLKATVPPKVLGIYASYYDELLKAGLPER